MSHVDYGACVDCRKAYECGSGSYGASVSWSNTVAEVDELLAKGGLAPETCSGRPKAWRAFLAGHAGHKFQRWDSDVAYIDDAGDLRLDYDDDLIEPEVGKFAWFYSNDDGTFAAEERSEPHGITKET